MNSEILRFEIGKMDIKNNYDTFEKNTKRNRRGRD